jgi:hypothetical protein
MKKGSQLPLPFAAKKVSPKRASSSTVKSLGEFKQQKLATENAKLDAAIIARARHLLR